MAEIPRVLRPRLAGWIFDRAITRRAAAAALECSYDSLRRYCLPFGDPERRIPDEQTIARIVAWTEGDLSAADFYPAHLAGRAAVETVGAAE